MVRLEGAEGDELAATEAGLLDAGPEAVEPLTRRLGQLLAWRRLTARLVLLVAPTIGLAAALGVWAADRLLFPGRPTSIPWGGMVGGLSASVAGWFISRAAIAQFGVRLTRALAGLGDVQAVPPLLEALGCPELRTTAEPALIRLLPRVTEADAEMLDARHRDRLHGLLTSSDRGVVLAALSALSSVGDGRALGPVKRLAARSADREVRDMADQCLAALQLRLALAASTAALLRPANGVEDVTLLRPASTGQEPPEEQLLRPAAGGGPAPPGSA